MTIDWINFSPWSALAGGALIGLAAGMFAVLNGRIAGVSGLLGSLLESSAEGRLEKALFVAGVLLAPVMWSVSVGMPQVEFDDNVLLLVTAGLLVGFGARYGSGCTSGHGVCGLSRLSLRSLIATLAFMCAGFVTVYILRHLMGG